MHHQASVELQKQIPAEISYLQVDAERRAEKAAKLEAQSKRALRRMKASAQAYSEPLSSPLQERHRVSRRMAGRPMSIADALFIMHLSALRDLVFGRLPRISW